jgi:hypothetical protein
MRPCFLTSNNGAFVVSRAALRLWARGKCQRLLLALALIATSRSKVASSQSAADLSIRPQLEPKREPQRPRIVLIHGRAQEYRVASQLRAEWIGALRDGLQKLGINEADVRDDDIEMISYQDAFEPEMPTREGCEPSELTAERLRCSPRT